MRFFISFLVLVFMVGCSFISYKDPTKEVFYGKVSKLEKVQRDEAKVSKDEVSKE